MRAEKINAQISIKPSSNYKPDKAKKRKPQSNNEFYTYTNNKNSTMKFVPNENLTIYQEEKKSNSQIKLNEIKKNESTNSIRIF
ncbi:39974_t:CDS:2 [Gigaspora margarita]|uniref:39974_t:CDS:1 n=1 Tax=Gigaspora margarita TaxID=4874 RepID=A0ABM8W148_GIGMA|nr:39974_t:CDS:2 [Gigaspora margarita]